MPDLLLICEVASILRCSDRSVRRIIARGELPVIPTGRGPKGDRVRAEDVESYKINRRHFKIAGEACPSTNVVPFGMSGRKSVDAELSALLAKAKKKPKNTKRRYTSNSETTATPNG